jgi:hypothetical protein
MDHHHLQVAMDAVKAEMEKVVHILCQAEFIPITNYAELEGIITLRYPFKWGGTSRFELGMRI